jgi:FeoB-associated Cys-rich membrane protein
MNADWQNAIVLMATAAAAGYLIRAAWQTFARKKAGACGGCAKCPAQATEPHVIGIAATVAPKSPEPGA